MSDLDASWGVLAEVPQHVFRAYDIRGEADDKAVSPALAYALGLAFGTEAKQANIESIVVGRDCRLSGEQLTSALIAGILQTGCGVINVGMVPTPLVYFATCTLPTDTGIMVTASHNPAHHNGFKMVLAGETVSTAGVQALYQRIVSRQFHQSEAPGTVTEHDIVPAYCDDVVDRIQLARPLKVVVDCGNGIAGRFVPDLYRRLGCDVVPLFCEVDGRFPNHHPDPTVLENLQDLMRVVQQQNADFGVAFDGDADRIGLVTEHGEVIWPDRQMLLFAEDVLSRHPGGTIVFDVKCSSTLPQQIAAWGGRPVMSRTGHSLVKGRMRQEAAPLAGEMSGHIFFQSGWYGFDDGIYVGARLMQLLSEKSQSCAEVFAAFPSRVNTPELKVPMDEALKSGFIERLAADTAWHDATCVLIDGLRIEFADGWGLVRASNTSSNLTLRFEGDTPQALQRIQLAIYDAMRRIDSDIELP